MNTGCGSRSCELDSILRFIFVLCVYINENLRVLLFLYKSDEC